MSKSTISTFQLFALIPDAETARLFGFSLWEPIDLKKDYEPGVIR
jgi:hypothetical protein